MWNSVLTGLGDNKIYIIYLHFIKLYSLIKTSVCLFGNLLWVTKLVSLLQQCFTYEKCFAKQLLYDFQKIGTEQTFSSIDHEQFP